MFQLIYKKSLKNTAFLSFFKRYRYRDACFMRFLGPLTSFNDRSKKYLVNFWDQYEDSNSLRASKTLGTKRHGNGNVSKMKETVFNAWGFGFHLI